MNKKKSSIYHFYFAYTLSRLSDRLWKFADVFLLEKIGGLKLIALSQFVNGLSNIFLSGILGKWLDKQNRMKSIKFVLFINNIFISLCAIAYIILLRMKNEINSNTFDIVIYIGLLLNGIGEVASEGEKLLLSKDWILVLINNDESELCKKNATLTTLDQISCIIAPIFIGFLLINLNYDMICVIFMIWNLISWIIEYSLLKKLYKSNINLHEKSCDKNIKEEGFSLLNIVQIYFSQSTCYQAIALSLLYMTVLSFDGLSLAYAKAQNITEDILGIFRAISSLTGMVGAFIYMKLERKIGALAASLCGLFIQQSFNYCCLLSLILPGTPFDPIGYFNEWNFKDWGHQLLSTNSEAYKQSTTLDFVSPSVNPSIWVYLLTITISRIGLWLAELAITHQMQQSAKDYERGVIFGFQNSLCNFFSIIKDVFVILLPDVKTFGILMILSVTFGTVSMLLNLYSYIKYKISRT